MADPWTGNLTWDSIMIVKAIKNPNANTIITAQAAAMIPVGALIICVLLIWTKYWKKLFREWITTTDHKKLGIMYVMFALLMLFRGVVEGTLMRVNQAGAFDGGLLSPDHFNQLFRRDHPVIIA